MLERRTVFILGAGASAPYGFPVGSELADEIVKGLQPKQVLRDQLLRAGFREADLDDVRDRLRLSGGTSIDFFLEGQPDEVVAIGKAAITLRIQNAEHNCREKEWLVTPLDKDGDHWLRYVWREMRPQSTRENLLAGSANVCFVTFNYDRTVERFFDTVLASNFGLRAEEAAKLRATAIEVIHLHGAIPEAFPFGSYGPDSALRAREASGHLVVVNEQVEPHAERLTLVRTRLHEASLICLLGFAYHRRNTERLELERIPEAVPIVGSVYRLGAAEMDRASGWIKRKWTRGGSDEKAETFLRQRAGLR
jgi:hypothetical protein